jgi:hypothetical protein
MKMLIILFAIIATVSQEKPVVCSKIVLVAIHVTKGNSAAASFFKGHDLDEEDYDYWVSQLKSHYSTKKIKNVVDVQICEDDGNPWGVVICKTYTFQEFKKLLYIRRA